MISIPVTSPSTVPKESNTSVFSTLNTGVKVPKMLIRQEYERIFDYMVQFEYDGSGGIKNPEPILGDYWTTGNRCILTLLLIIISISQQ